ncbi:hypothetical protein RIF29_41982 [Crotalaria pallida]|uniref:Uncharacterized protein n=1 Tax=Crotalaria pallida TaxID=3830 RepID=A0AAN9EBL6_CROPI
MDNRNGFSGTGLNKGSSSENSNRKKLLISRGIAMQDEKEDVNRMAESFIKNFRKQMKIEREKSFKGLRI